jgi:hypothetical protein
MSLTAEEDIPENYDLRKIVQAPIDELVGNKTLDRGSIRTRIIEKGNPERNNKDFERFKAK